MKKLMNHFLVIFPMMIGFNTMLQASDQAAHESCPAGMEEDESQCLMSDKEREEWRECKEAPYREENLKKAFFRITHGAPSMSLEEFFSFNKEMQEARKSCWVKKKEWNKDHRGHRNHKGHRGDHSRAKDDHHERP